jgi:hypothetical protein
MTTAKLTVANLLTVYQIRRQHTVPQLELFGVDVRIVVPADTEFPRTLPQLDVFGRFFIRQAGTAKFRFRLQWLGGTHNRRDQTVYEFARQFDTTRTYQDECFRLPHLRLLGEGWYRLTLSQSRQANWKGQSWARLAATAFHVEKRT